MAAAPPVMTQEQFLRWQQQYMMQTAQQQTMQQQAYFQWMTRQWAAQQAAMQRQMQQNAAAQQDDSPEELSAFEPQQAPETFSPAAEPDFDMTAPTVEFHTGENFYPPEMTGAEEAAWPYAAWPEELQSPSAEGFVSPYADDDQTDAAAPPKSAYVGEDEAQKAKQAFWDRYLGGGAQ